MARVRFGAHDVCHDTNGMILCTTSALSSGMMDGIIHGERIGWWVV